MRRFKGKRANFLLLFFTCVLMFVLLETAFRLIEHKKYSRMLKERIEWGISGGSEAEKMLRQHIEVPLRRILKIHENPRIIYDLIPNQRSRYAANTVLTNSEGFRDREYEITKDGSVRRILGIGDSLMFGQAVAQGSTYLAVLEEMSNLKGQAWEVINTAVPGYNTVMEVETLKVKGLKYNPELVILGYVSNDICLPNFIRNETHFLDPGRSFFLDFVRWRMRDAGIRVYNIINAAEEHFRKCDEESVPDQYRFMVGLEAVRKSLVELKELGEEYDFEVLVVLFTPEADGSVLRVAGICRDLGFHLVSVGGALREYMEENGIDDYGSSPLVVKGDGHPSAIAHRIAAESLMGYLESSGLLRPRRQDAGS
jgi:hypothetical protein